MRNEIKKSFGSKGIIFLIVYGLFLIYAFCEFSTISYTDYIWSEFNDEYNFSIKILVVVLSVVFAQIFPIEQECGMYELVTTSKYGKNRLPRIKIKSALVIGNMLLLLFLIVTAFSIGRWGKETGNNVIMEAKLLPFLKNPYIHTNIELVLHKMFESVFAVNMSILLSLWLSVHLKKAIETAVMMIIFHIVFSSSVLANALNFDVISLLICSLPVNMICQPVLHTLLFSFGDKNMSVIYLVNVIYIVVMLVLNWRIRKYTRRHIW